MGNANLDSKATLSIDEWSIQSYTPVVYPANWGDLDNDGINDALEALFGGDSSDPDDFLTVLRIRMVHLVLDYQFKKRCRLLGMRVRIACQYLWSMVVQLYSLWRQVVI